MFRNICCASVEAELSNALVARTHDLTETVSETRTSMLDFSANHSCIPPCEYESRGEAREQRAPKLFVFCHCRQVTALLLNKSTERRVAGEGIYLMSDLPEF
jgi:hypothetical protein